MYEVQTTNQFEKDVVRCKKRGLNLTFLKMLCVYWQNQENCRPPTSHINFPANIPGVGNATLNPTG